MFAPHYAAPMATVVTRATGLFGDRNLSEPLGDLATGEAFDVLELAGNHAWGRATARGLVGYVDRTALDVAAVQDDAA